MAKPAYYYGIHAVYALLNQRPQDALTLFVQPQASSTEPLLQLAQQYGIGVQTTQKDKLTRLCGSSQHQGVVLHARPKPACDGQVLEALIQKTDAFFLLLDQVTDAHNLGACLRSAAVMGVDAVICPKHYSAGLTPTVAKVSVGASELVPVIYVTNLVQTIKTLKEGGVFVYGAAVRDAKPAYAYDLRSKVALIMGSEGDGLRRLTQVHCDGLLYVPMPGARPEASLAPDEQNPIIGLDSLNVSVATGILLYEAMRQRLTDPN